MDLFEAIRCEIDAAALQDRQVEAVWVDDRAVQGTLLVDARALDPRQVSLVVHPADLREAMETWDVLTPLSATFGVPVYVR